MTIADRQLIARLKREIFEQMEAMLAIQKEFTATDKEDLIQRNKLKTKNRCEDMHARKFRELFEMMRAFEERARTNK